VRHSGLSLGPTGISYLESGDWTGSFAYRWLQSDHHFRGDEDEGPVRYALGNEVINDTHSFELAAGYAVTPRYSVNLTMPFVYNTRSSLYEHDRTNRYETSAGGLADLRLTGYAWLLRPETHTNGNIALGVGMKAPTGDWDATDDFHTPTGVEIRPVDQSIQPGDGGWGIILEIQAVQKLFDNAYAFLSGSYLINPREMNGTRTYRETLSPALANEAIMSVPDQYFGKLGFSYLLWPEKGLFVSLAGRVEGVPVRDLIGGSDGFRRPGIAVSVEPGVGFNVGRFSFNVSAPVAVYRNRFQSVTDKEMGRHGDAAFADWFILAGVSRRF